jgi:hypothetical protein
MTPFDAIKAIQKEIPNLKNHAKGIVETIRESLPIQNESWRTKEAFQRNPQRVFKKLHRIFQKMEIVLTKIKSHIHEHSAEMGSLPQSFSDLEWTFRELHNLAESLPSRSIVQLLEEPIPSAWLTRFLYAVNDLEHILESSFPNSLLNRHLAAMREYTKRESKKPRWDRERGELWHREELVKQFWQPSKNQRKILDEFQAEGWRSRIDDPIGDSQKLADALRRLNVNPGILFKKDGRGGILWEAKRL